MAPSRTGSRPPGTAATCPPQSPAAELQAQVLSCVTPTTTRGPPLECSFSPVARVAAFHPSALSADIRSQAMRSQQAKEHHLVPKYWLRAFAEDGHVTGRHRDGREFRTPVRGAAKATHFNTDPLAQGQQRVAMETYLAEQVDHHAAPVILRLRNGVWPLPAEDREHLLRALGWQLVRTQLFRSWNRQVGEHLAPVIWAHQVIGVYQTRLGRMLRDEEGVALFWHAYQRAPDPALFSDVQWHLRAPIQGHAFAMEYLSAPDRHLVIVQSDSPQLVLGDTGVVVRRTSGTYSINPPLLGASTELYAPIAPTHLLISTRTPGRYGDGILTSALVRNANRGAAAWCQGAVYRLPTMRWPRNLRLGPTPPLMPPPRIAATPDGRRAGTPPQRPVQNDPRLQRLLSQFSRYLDAS
ncbi:DUF4238 domain-containing protein [Streptomyces sp. NPDC005132]|uniref:DUF4238 domain-containing protein n=1 Tax=Streptomyces sp. NPDC005132 TaxID=3154294 RepID=UPI0033B2A306